ncbi:amino acid ABC transporter permease [Achromatium sp. WMS1]|nr:amino acid ABC transporter permease [Achromatium sp. WMS1]
MNKILFIVTVIISLFPTLTLADGLVVKIGSKNFTENVILGELVYNLAKHTDIAATHWQELGGTAVLWKALHQGNIDIYPDYTGTLLREILARQGLKTFADLRRRLHQENIEITRPLGFNNTYAIGMKRTLAARLSIENISDLRQHPQLKLGFSDAFMARKDGWQGLRRKYQLPHEDVRGLNHELAYQGIEKDAIDITDAYATDAEIAYYDLKVIEDDLEYFPRYDAVFLYRSDLAQKAPHLITQIQQLAGNISASEMIQMNKRAKLDKVPSRQVAADFLAQKFSIYVDVTRIPLWYTLYKLTLEHLFLVGVSLFAAIVIAIPLGIAAYKYGQIGQIILGIVGLIQTIPSLAILVFMIPLLGIGNTPAIAALFFYSLLPIVRNTYTGLNEISPGLQESAQALGLHPLAKLRLIELPLASRAILAGIKTSAIINIGTATLGALIGAGGYGQPILTGIRLDDMSIILRGAIPAAILALLVQFLFELSEKMLVPEGLRIRSR